jgi:hypothetical protein
MHSVKSPNVKPKVQRKKEHPTFLLVQNNPFNLTAKILLTFSFLFLWEKIDGLMTMVWVSILVQPYLPSRVRRLGQKVLPCRHFGKRQPLDSGF